MGDKDRPPIPPVVSVYGVDPGGTFVYAAPDPGQWPKMDPLYAEPGTVIQVEPSPAAEAWASLYARIHRLEGALQAIIDMAPNGAAAKVARGALEAAKK